MAIKEGKWKCSYCASVNRGRDTSCAACGKIRGKDVQFYLDDESAEVTDTEQIKQAQAGADWTCAFCETNNRASETKCHQCGALKGTSPSLKEKFIPEGEDIIKTRPPVKSKKSAAGWIIGAAAAVLIILSVFLFFSTSAKTAVLMDAHWERTINIQHLSWVEHTDWEGSVPAGAVILDKWKDQYGTEKVQTGTQRVKTGTRDKGNGYFEDVYEDRPVYREDPVYKMKYRYKIKEWINVRAVKTEGGLTNDLVWPEFVLGLDEREGQHQESAELTFQTDKKNYKKSIKPEELSGYKIERKYVLHITPLGVVTKITQE